MVETVIGIALSCLLIIIYIIREYYYQTERLTGKWYIRRKIGFVSYDVVVEVKVNNEVFTRLATDRDIEVLRNKFKIRSFKLL